MKPRMKVGSAALTILQESVAKNEFGLDFPLLVSPICLEFPQLPDSHPPPSIHAVLEYAM